MSTSKRKAPRAGKNRKLDNSEEAIPSLTTTIGDLPPEVLTKILEFVALDGNRSSMLEYRPVSSQWKDILDSIIEKRILSGDFPISPGIKIVGVGRQYEKLHVRYYPTRFPDGSNPFPFNSLLLTGNRNDADFNYDPELLQAGMILAAFTSEFGGNLTSLGLQDQIFPIQILVTLLGSMSSLKRISLTDVKQHNVIIRAGAVLPTPPTLPSLTALEIKSRSGQRDNRRNILFIWLITSYADQLVSLSVETFDPFPPLRKDHQYSYKIFGVNEEVIIASTSESSAFRKLKELKIYRPTRDFLELSEIPGLLRLSINELGRETGTDFRNVVHFIGNCSGTLEKLWLNVRWEQLLSWGINMDDLARGSLFSPGSARVVVPKLKMLEMHYPYEDIHEFVLNNESILMFPALEKLHLLHFHPHSFDKWMDVVGARYGPGNEARELQNENNPVDVIVGLKSRLVSHREEMHDMLMGIFRQQDDFIQVPAAENEPLQRMMDLEEDSAMIFNRLQVLGEKREKIHVELLLERREFWRLWTNLKIVSVSLGGESDGDVCVIRRPVDA